MQETTPNCERNKKTKKRQRKEVAHLVQSHPLLPPVGGVRPVFATVVYLHKAYLPAWGRTDDVVGSEVGHAPLVEDGCIPILAVILGQGLHEVEGDESISMSCSLGTDYGFFFPLFIYASTKLLKHLAAIKNCKWPTEANPSSKRSKNFN